MVCSLHSWIHITYHKTLLMQAPVLFKGVGASVPSDSQLVGVYAYTRITQQHHNGSCVK